MNHDAFDDLFKDSDLLSNKELKKQKVELDNFWDEDIKIKNVRLSNENINRYKIKDWDVDRKIKDLFEGGSKKNGKKN